MRKKIVAGNWKMNLSFEEAVQLNREIEEKTDKKDVHCAIYQFIPSIYIHSLLKNSKNITVGAQNGYPKKEGAFTGEISMHQLQKLQVKAVLIGHSERRQIFGEKDSFLKEKVDAALAEGLQIFFCCGETLREREDNQQEEVILSQLNNSLFHLPKSAFKDIVIAYEPIWAIGTGKTASPEEANAMHSTIRRAIATKYNATIAEETPLLYGGSCKPNNAKELFSQPDIDGGLIGGSSLKSDEFLAIIRSL